MSAAPTSSPRPSGGFNPGMGQFGEHLDEAAMQQAMKQKGMTQQAASTAAVPTPLPQTQPQAAPAPPREIGSLTEELLVRPGQDIWEGLKSIFDLQAMLGLNQKTPEQQQELARQEMLLKRFNQLTEEQQAIAKQEYQERLAKKQQEEQERQQKEAAERQQQQQQLHVPSTPQKGPIGPGMSGSQKAKAQLDWDRQRLTGPQSAG